MMFWVFVSIVFVMDVVSGLLVAIKTKSLKTVYIKKPSIILGDMIIIPLIGGYILNYYYSFNLILTQLFSELFLLKVGVIAVLLALVSALRFKTTNIWYWPHGVFLCIYSFLVVVISDWGSRFPISVLVACFSRNWNAFIFGKEIPKSVSKG